jgi:glutathione S-transferase
MTIKVHHLNNSRSQRILWLLEELEVPYEIISYQRDATTRLAPPELKKIHALGKSPVVEDGGNIVAESGAIIEYLARRHGKGKLWPAETSPTWLQNLHFMHYAEGSAMLPLMLALYTGMLGDAAAPLQPRIQSELANHFGYMEHTLSTRPYFSGKEFMACDVQMTFILEAADARGRLAGFPSLADYLKRMEQRPAYKRAIDKGGPYTLGR